MKTKSTVQQIRERFDSDVERFSNLQTGQTAMPDAALMLQLTADAVAAITPHATDLLDIGCGAGNYSLKTLQNIDDLNVTLVDLSSPMLERAEQRISEKTAGRVVSIQTDVRQLSLPDASQDAVVAAAVLHHLRGEYEWRCVFESIYRWLRPGGCFFIADMIDFAHPAIKKMMVSRYGNYLTEFRDEAYRDHVFAYIEQEDSPRSLMFQMKLMEQVGFDEPMVLHHSYCGGVFGAVKS